MASITQSPTNAKILVVGASGAGKTGAKASLICAGYQLRMIDTDHGANILYSLLTHPKYPYAKIIKEKNIDISKAVDIVPIDLGMEIGSIKRDIGGGRFSMETVIKPKNSSAWLKAIKLLERWKDGTTDYGPVTSWDDNCILDLDTLSTLSKDSYYFIQDLNGRLGARDEGYDYQRDVGGAQSQLTRLLELLYDSSIRCNVIVNSHITWVDESRGFAANPDQVARAGRTPNPEGLPSAIGRALSPQIGKYFNDQFVLKIEGSHRRIKTIPTDGISAKASTWLEPSYDISTGLAEIFAALRRQPHPAELVKAIGYKPAAQAEKSTIQGGIATQKIA